jgi:hypothetical protein
MNPMQLFSMMMNGKMPENFTSNIMNEVAQKITGTLYKEINADETMKKTLFIKDPRNSEKIKALQILVQEGITKVLPKMKQEDVDMLYNVLQKCKED